MRAGQRRGHPHGGRGSLLTGVTLAIAFALVAAACGGGGTSGTTGGSTGGSGNGILRYGYDFDAQFTGTFDNSKSNGDCDQIITTLIYDTLIHIDLKGNLLPGLATKWQVDPPGNKIELWIRPGVKFSDGSPLDGQAVINGLQTNATSQQLTSVAMVTSYALDPKDPMHVILGYKDDTGIQLIYAFVHRDGMIMSTKSIVNKTADQHPVGAGPFMLTKYEKGSLASVRPNPNYWDKANTYKFGGIDFTKVGTGPPTVTAFEAGQLDFIRLETDGAPALQNNSKYKVVIQPSGAYLQFQFRLHTLNGKPTVFANQLVREAFEVGLDRVRINQAAQQGLGQVTDQPFPASNPVHDASLDNYWKYDPQRAKDLLTQAGYPHGFTFKMVIPGGGIANMEHQAVEVQQELKQIGVTAKIVRILPSEIATGYYTSQTGDAFAAEALASTFPGGSLNDRYAKGQYVAIYNGAEIPEITTLMTDALSQSNIADSIKLARQADRIVVTEALEVPIAFAPQLNAYVASKVHGPLTAQDDICDPPDLSHITVSG
jgi:peptide/nickel transport system substrate-binding protein